MMIKRILLLIGAPLLVMAIGWIPNALIRNTPQADYTFVSTKQIAERVYAYGEVCPGEEYELYLPSSAVAKNVFVSVGNHVKKGSVLATVDQWLGDRVEEKPPLDEKALLAAAEYGVIPDGIFPSFASNIQTAREAHSSALLDPQICAPADGIITEINLKRGTASDYRKPAIRIEVPNTKAVRLYLSEKAMQYVSLGDPVTIQSDSFSDTLHGIVVEIGENAMQRDMTGGREIELLVDLQENTSNLKNGFTVEGTIQLEEPRWAMIVPYEAILQDKNNQEYVYIYENGRAIRRNIISAKELSDGVEVLGGLSGSETLIISSTILQDGERILLRGEYNENL